MFIEARLIFQSYMPRRLEKGMLFQRKVSMRKLKTNIEYKEVFELKEVPRDIDSYVSINGWPVEPYIYSITANPDDHAVILATPELIGWWDDEPDAVYEEDDEEGTLRDIEVKDYNYVLENYEGNIDIQVDEQEFKNGIVKPIIYIEKVTLSIPMIKDNTDEEDDWDVTSGDGLEEEEEEDWDDMDDLTENEWPFDHPKDKTDYDPE